MRVNMLIATIMGLFWAGEGTAQQTCGSVSECAQMAVENAAAARQALELAVPAGAIMAFNLSVCPAGWTEFSSLAGRVAVGAGKGAGLAPRLVGDAGGEESHTLTIEEMPAHAHGYVDRRARNRGPCAIAACSKQASDETRTTAETGSGKAHNNMPPFYVVTYCVRK
jgi:hypothetical protein